MKIIGWIREGDKAACGGAVVEGDHTCTSDGRAYSFQGARMACRKNCVIAEGWMTSTLTNGRAQVLHAMKTTGGCPLESTLNDRDGWSNEGGEVPVKFFKNAAGQWTGITAAALASGAVTTPDDEGAYDELAQLDMGISEGMPYFVETTDGRTFSGRISADGLLPRIDTYGEDEYTVYWGEDAIARTTGEQA